MGDVIDQVFGGFPDWHARVLRTIDHGDTVVAEIRMAERGSGSGLEVEQTTWQVTRFRGGKMPVGPSVGLRGHGGKNPPDNP